MEKGAHSGALSAPQRSSYLQYKRNTSFLIRWVVTTAAACNLSCEPPKPKNNNPKNKKKAARATRAAENSALSPEITVARFVSLSTAIAEAGEAVPDTILWLFDSVIRARTAAYECFKEIWTQSQDEDVGESNERHFAFIVALQTAFDTLGGAAWKKKQSEDGKRPSSHQTQVKSLKDAHESEAIRFINQFKELEVEDVPSEDEKEVEELANPEAPTEGFAEPEPTASKAKSKGKGKGKKKKAATHPLEDYKFTSHTEIYYAVCFFVRDFLELRRYTRDLWKQVGLGHMKCVVAGALSELAVGMIKSLQFELAVDYPGCTYYRGIVNWLVRNDSPEIIGSIPASNGSAKTKQLIPSHRRDGMREVEEEMLLTTHDDLASFITDFRKNRTGKASPAFNKTAWNPNFSATAIHISDMTYQRVRQWKADYAISFMYDLVNTYKLGRLLGEKDPRNPETFDWRTEDPSKYEWMTRKFWGANEFAAEMTKLAMQKPGSQVIEELRPHHVFQLQLALDSMMLASRWHAQDNKTVPPRNLYGETSPTLAWDLTASHLHDLRRIRDRWIASTEIMLHEFEEDRKRQMDPGLWSHPITRLSIIKDTAVALGDTPLQFAAVPKSEMDDLHVPKSLFANSNSNGLWLYSPYLCGIGQVEFLNMSYDWGSKCWDRSDLIVSFFHIYNALRENGHMKKPINVFDRLLQVFERDIFRTGRPKLGGRPWAFTDANMISAGIKAQFLRSGSSSNQRKTKGELRCIFRHRGAPSRHSKFLDASKLFELHKANWISTRVDVSKFPSLEKTPRRLVEFLDAVKVDLEKDFDAETPIATLNYHSILAVIMVLYQGMNESIQDLPSVQRIMAETRAETGRNDFGWQDKMTTLALHTDLALLQDSQGERLDTPILRAMGKTLDEFWNKMGDEVAQIFILNEPEAEEDKVSEPGKIRLMGENKYGMASLRDKLEGVRFTHPELYERAIHMAENMPVGGCDTCPDCQAGVPIDAIPEKCCIM